jgi:hypothetical protein
MSGVVPNGIISIQKSGILSAARQMPYDHVSLWRYDGSNMLFIMISHCLHFQTIDKGEARELAFTNILDKGYRCVLAAWRAGGQLLLQPFFAKSDQKFSNNEVLLSGAVATDHRSVIK